MWARPTAARQCRLKVMGEVDAESIGILGFSRGGLLTLMAIKERPEQIRMTVLMAPATGNNAFSNTLQDLSPGSDRPILILVSQNGSGLLLSAYLS